MRKGQPEGEQPTPTEYSYDRIPYKSFPFSDTHPSRIATIGHLFGLNPPNPETAKVLELGSSSGGNIIPMALAYPNAHFYGIDLSKVEIEMGQKVVDKLGLKNVTLKQLNILDLDESFGTFDYMICHGVYSWVPPEVQSKILSIARERLSPTGMAYISYNTYPGWHMMNIVRDMMLFHSSRYQDPTTQIAQARSLLNFVARWVPSAENPFGAFIKKEAENFLQRSDYYLYHEHLEDINEPMYFCEFVEQAQQHGLDYVGETHVGAMIPNRLPAEAQEALRLLAPDVITMEQYLDFLRNRTFRRTLLTRRGAQLNRNITWQRLENLFIASNLKKTEGPDDLLSKEPTKFKTPSGSTLTTAEPLLKVAVTMLASVFPRTLTLDQLQENIVKQLKLDPKNKERMTELRRNLGGRLLTCYLNDAIELHSVTDKFTTAISPLPAVSPLARLQIADGDQVTSLRHHSIKIPEQLLTLLPKIDGSHDHKSLEEFYLREIRRPVVMGTPSDSEATEARNFIGRCLRYLANNALLVG